jgi:hypothetical protein
MYCFCNILLFAGDTLDFAPLSIKFGQRTAVFPAGTAYPDRFLPVENSPFPDETGCWLMTLGGA